MATWGVFIVDLDKLTDPDWKTLPLGALYSSELWHGGVGLTIHGISDESREKVRAAVEEIQREERRDGQRGP